MKHAPAFLQLVENVMVHIHEISTDEVVAAKGPMVIIDVREDSEWAKGHIPGAVHLGRGVIERDIEDLYPDKGTRLVLYCGGGYRSALAAESLQKMGYRQVLSMAGGWREWNEKGLPTE